jgi:hypothetical protein
MDGEPSTDGRDFYKIGRTTDRSIDSRIKTLQTANPYQLEFVLILKGDREGTLHDQFHNWRVSGEWFLLHQSQILKIEGTSWEWEEQYIWKYYACRERDGCPCPLCDPYGDPSMNESALELLRSAVQPLPVRE